MSNGRIDEDRLLDGAGPATDPVARLLAAARAPARRHELSGEEAAASAFRSFRVPGDTGRRRRAARGRWAGAIGLKVAAVALALTTGGVAVAASTGILPSPIIKTSSPATDPAGPTARSAAPSSSYADRRTASPGAPSVNGSASSTGAEHASSVRLCRAYQARYDRDPGKSLDSAAFAALIASAGGEDQIEAYCLIVLAQTTPGPPVPRPSPTGSTGGGSGNSHQPAGPEAS